MNGGQARTPASEGRPRSAHESEPRLTAGGPLQLNDLGRKVSAEIQADEWAAEIAPSLAERAAAEPAYKVDALCGHYVEQFLHQEMRDRVDEAAYEHGIERPGVLAVLRIMLRNRILGDRQEDPDAPTARNRERTTDAAGRTVPDTA